MTPSLKTSTEVMTPSHSHPSTPTHHDSLDAAGYLGRITKALESLLVKTTLQSTITPGNSTEDETKEDPKTIEKQPQTDYKIVTEVWKDSRYRIQSSSSATGENPLDQYVFIVRERLKASTRTDSSTFYVDIKSVALEEILKQLLKNVTGVNLRDEKPTFERNLLYHFLFNPSLHDSGTSNLTVDPSSREHFRLLVDYIQKSYAAISRSVTSLLERNEITFEHIWCIFKPNDIVFAGCFGTDSPRCIIFDHGEVKILDGEEYFHVEGRYIDFDSNRLGLVTTAVGIAKFRGAKRINELEVFPLKYHSDKEGVSDQLIKRGLIFSKLGGCQVRQYKGPAFEMRNGKIQKSHVDSRVVVGCSYFFETNPNYQKPRIDDSKTCGILCFIDLESSKMSNIVQSRVSVPQSLSDDEFLICSPTIPGFCLGTKQWLDLAVGNIEEIEWNTEPFERLTLPEGYKELIQSTVMSFVDTGNDFDDFMPGKGRGLIMLLHGPPGVGKTLTAESLAEHLQRPLYTISSAELPADPRAIETLLDNAFKQVKQWNAILLIDEADVFMRQRSLDHASNTHITAFLRTLEYFKGIMFLTTNRVRDFDDAIRSRVHLPIEYPSLGQNTKKELWKQFLERYSSSSVNEEETSKLANHELNGRQIKNTVKLGIQLAEYMNSVLTYTLLESVLKKTQIFGGDFGAGRKAHEGIYT